MQASILIVSWNGAHVLQATVPRVLEAVREHGEPDEVVVVDNGSSDETPALLASFGPAVRAVRLAANQGLAGGFNAGLRHCRHEAVVTLCNDILVRPDFLRPLLAHLGGPLVFAASPRKLHGGTVEHVRIGYRFDEAGLFAIDIPGMLQPEGVVPRPRAPTWCAPWCNGAFRRSVLLGMGGFEEGVGGRVGWWSEIDPSYRAWKRGWRVVFEPESVVEHLRAQTGYPGVTLEMNDYWYKQGQLFFTWANLSDAGLLARHLAALPGLVGAGEAACVDALRGLLAPGIDPGVVAGRVAALPLPPPGLLGWPGALASVVRMLPRVVARRRIDGARERCSDLQLLQTINR